MEVVEKVLNESGEKPGRWLLGAYWVAPLKKFINQQQDEQVVLMLRQHPVTNIPWLVAAIGAAIFPAVVLGSGLLPGIPGKFLIFGLTGWYLLVTAFVIERFLGWFYSVFIVTNERLVDIDFYNLVHRVVTCANLNHIEEPAMATGGFIRSMFQYGDVVVTTASKLPSIEALAVPWPHKVVDIITRLAEELEKRRERGE